MTYRELLGCAPKKIDNNEITIGEYIEMTKVLNQEVDVLDKIRAEIIAKHLKNIEHDDYSLGYSIALEEVVSIIDKYRNEVSE